MNECRWTRRIPGGTREKSRLGNQECGGYGHEVCSRGCFGRTLKNSRIVSMLLGLSVSEPPAASSPCCRRDTWKGVGAARRGAGAGHCCSLVAVGPLCVSAHMRMRMRVRVCGACVWGGESCVRACACVCAGGWVWVWVAGCARGRGGAHEVRALGHEFCHRDGCAVGHEASQAVQRHRVGRACCTDR